MKTLEQKLETVIELKYSDCKNVFAVPGEGNFLDVVRPDTGLSWCYNHNLDQIRKRYPGAVEMPYEDWIKAKAATQDTPIIWTETSKEKYWEMLEVLPPAAMGNGGFLVGEPWDHHAITGQPRFAGYREWHGKFFAASRPMTRKEYAAEMLKSPMP